MISIPKTAVHEILHSWGIDTTDLVTVTIHPSCIEVERIARDDAGKRFVVRGAFATTTQTIALSR